MLKLTLGTDSTARKDIPIFSGCIAYFTAALAGVARHSKRGNDKHNPGEPLHHARGKSMDHSDCVPRHTIDMGDMLAYLERERGDMCDGERAELVKGLLEEADALCWRALAWSQELYERYGGAPLASAAREPKVAPKPAEGPDAVEQYRLAELSKGPPDYPGRPTASQQFCRLAGCITVIDKPREYCDEHNPTAVLVAAVVATVRHIPEVSPSNYAAERAAGETVGAALCLSPGCYNNRAPRGGRYCVAHIPSSM